MPSGQELSKSIKRQSKSCKRCLKRKQRCHGFPICSGCEEAKQRCEQSEYALQLHKHDSSYAAFERIQTLQTQLAGALGELTALRQGQQHPLGGADCTNEFLLGQQKQASKAQEQQLPIPPILHKGCILSNNVTGYPRGGDDFGYSMEPGGDRSSHESNMEQMVQATVWVDALSSVGDDVPAGLAPTSEQGLQSCRAQPPSDGKGRRMLEAYFEKIHPRYPFLERSELLRLHAQRYDPVPSTAFGRFGMFKLNMVYAIGGTLLKLIDPAFETQVGSFLATALQHVSSVTKSNALHSIEGMTLLVLYSLRSLSNTGIWYLIGLAMRTCVDIGLNLESSYTAEDPFQSLKKRRLFWSVYLLDRFIAISLRRPLGIAEHDIDTNIPSQIEEDSTHQGIDANSPIDLSNPKSTAKLNMWAKLIQVKQFESRIHTDVYCLNETRQQRFTKVEPLLASLDTWGQSTLPVTGSEISYLQLQWNGAVSQLLRPFLSVMRRDDPLISRCLKASGHVCNIFKRMHQRDSYSHSFISAHLIFISGVTMCYCLFLAPNLFNSSIANSLRACSSTMFVMAERSPGLRKHRDILEDIIGHILDSSVGSGLKHYGDLNDLQGQQQRSQLDAIAVQSLLNLSAQQEPQEVSSLNGQEQSHPQHPVREITLQPTGHDDGPGPFVPVERLAPDRIGCRPSNPRDPAERHSRKRKRHSSPAATIDTLENTPDWNLNISWDVDGYSLEMLDSMTGVDFGF